MRSYLSVLLLLILFTGCQTDGKAIFRPMTQEQEVKLKKVIITESDRIPGEDLEYITKIKGIACKQRPSEPEPTVAQAIAQLQVKAAKALADAVINTRCVRSKGLEFKNTAYSSTCFMSITCSGRAMRFEESLL